MKVRLFDWNLRTAFLLLLFGITLFNFPFFSSKLWPQHDTIYAYQNFYTFYQQFFYHNELVRWYPYGTYGIKADLTQLFNLAPSAYFVGILGKLLEIQNAMFLFKFSLTIEEFLFLIGFFLLCRHLFRDLKIVFLTCLTGIGSTVWYVQVYWNFRIYYLLPLIIYFFAQFMKKQKGHYFWICGIVFLCSFIGNLPYFTILYLPIFLILFVTFFLKYRSVPWKSALVINRKNASAFLICMAIGIIYFLFASHADNGVISYQKGRDPVNHALDINTFLTNGSGIGFEKFLGFFFEIPHENFTVYMGWLPLLFLLYGMLKVRKIEFWGILSCGIFLALFSAGGEFPLATLLYRFFIPMKWFQYIGQIASLARIFFILAAGFGIQHFLTNFNRQNRNLFLLLAIALFVTFVILLRVCEDSIPLANNALRAFYFAAAILFILAVGLMFRIKMSGKQAAFLLGTFLFLDFTAYHFALASAWTRPQLTTNALTDVVAFDRYQPMRVLEPEFRSHPRRVMVEQDPIERLGIDALNFIQVDPCFEIYTSLLIPENIWRYLEVRANYTRKKNITGYRAEWINSVPLFYEIGCHVPKLRLIENVLIAKEESEVESLLKSNQDLNRIVILDSHGNASEASTPSRTNHLGSIRVNSFSYNQIALEVNVKGSDGAWLYYADTYHADWKATVNQKETFIYPANLAFKAVRLPAGTSQVRMSFNHGKSDFLAKIIAVIGFFFVLAVLSFTFLILPNNA